MSDADDFSLSLIDFAIQSIEDALRSGLAEDEFASEADCALKVLKRHFRNSDAERFAKISLLFHGFDIARAAENGRRDKRDTELGAILERLKDAKELITIG